MEDARRNATEDHPSSDTLLNALRIIYPVQLPFDVNLLEHYWEIADGNVNRAVNFIFKDFERHEEPHEEPQEHREATPHTHPVAAPCMPC